MELAIKKSIIIMMNYEEIKMERWKYRQCGFIYEGEEAPDHCPVCGYPKAYFERMCENY